MAQPLKVDRPVRKNICLPQSLVARVDLELWSEVEGKVPFAAWQGYIEGLIRKDLQSRIKDNNDQKTSWEYKGYFIVFTEGVGYRVKQNLTDAYALHHGSHISKEGAMAFINKKLGES